MGQCPKETQRRSPDVVRDGHRRALSDTRSPSAPLRRCCRGLPHNQLRGEDHFPALSFPGVVNHIDQDAGSLVAQLKAIPVQCCQERLRVLAAFNVAGTDHGEFFRNRPARVPAGVDDAERAIVAARKNSRRPVVRWQQGLLLFARSLIRESFYILICPFL